MTGPLRALDALDDRVVGGLAALDRRVVPGLVRRPGAVVVLIGLLFLGSGAARLSILSEDAGAPPPPEEVTVAPAAPEQRGAAREAGEDALLVGPERGADVQRYVAERRAALTDAAADAPGAPAVAIVSFARYLLPEDAERVMGEVRILAARYRLPVDDPFAEEGVAALTRGRVGAEGGLAAALVPALQEEAAQAREQAEELESLEVSADDPEFAEAFRRDRNRLLAAAALVGERGCACVYALEVQASLADLAALLDAEEIRVVDIAPVGSGGAVAFTALLPEEDDLVGGPGG
jgi:hypothetical protein